MSWRAFSSAVMELFAVGLHRTEHLRMSIAVDRRQGKTMFSVDYKQQVGYSSLNPL
jgi:hypothetical protein